MDSFFNYRVSRSLIKIGLALIIILFSSCDKEVDPAKALEREFLASIIGDWQASEYEYQNHESSDTTVIIIYKDFPEINYYAYRYAIRYDQDSTTLYEKEYHKSDQILCGLNKMDVMQAWTIVHENDILKLYASDQCGYNETFEIIVNSLRDLETQPGYIDVGGIYADLTLVNQYSETRLNQILVYYGSISFEIHSDGDERFWFSKD